MGGDDGVPGRPFAFVTRADGTIIVTYREAPVRALRGRTAERFLARVKDADGEAGQQAMYQVARDSKRRPQRERE